MSYFKSGRTVQQSPNLNYDSYFKPLNFDSLLAKVLCFNIYFITYVYIHIYIYLSKPVKNRDISTYVYVYIFTYVCVNM